MKAFDRKKHWEHIYETKGPEEVSWFQAKPKISLDLIKELDLPETAQIIDVGGGDSLLVDHLLEIGYRDISVLDISEMAIHKTEKRLGHRAGLVKWIVNDVIQLNTSDKYDLWHDRATFHFFTQEDEIKKYIEIAYKSLKDNGVLILGTFSDQGPKKCSGIDIHQYSEKQMTDLLENYFKKIKCFRVDHPTPKGEIQDFLFCVFRKIPQKKID
ncbi:class I SAM-dependent methyltransferase [Echinicola jeungdonensis]|uniref:Class I SAM-dependent methyltransferase n=1 Tax=Echinicola jeungdonensis TaxID=709343 RepID=A0ABV5J7C6_9BACT|nr:class I SAM-dependent methyltransferase [Echinicola jeungdonensis]MDN3669105.1 class I SAM-dependent methyltransferase [Echinicola jeungdonensis]